jgi:hypothetical protein
VAANLLARARLRAYCEIVDKDTEPAPFKLEIERLSTADYFKEMLLGVARTLGLGILWGLEIARDAYFSLLDRMNVRPHRHKRASAFPPGRPRKRSTS